MKTKIYSVLVSLVAVFCLTGCDDWTPGSTNFAKNTGGVSLGDLEVNVSDEATVVSRASRAIDTSGYLVTVTDQTTGAIAAYDGNLCSWTYSEMPEVMTLPVGDYTVTVRSHEVEKAAWSAPYYEGSADFTIKDGEVTSIGTVTCLFSAIKVSVQFSDALAEKITDAKAEVVAGDGGSLTWSLTETRFGYFEAVDGSTTLVATFTGSVDGTEITKYKEFTDVESGKYYIITFSLKSGDNTVPDEYGNVDPEGISVDATIDEQDENGDIDAGEDGDSDDNGRPGNEEWPDDNSGDDGDDSGDEPASDTIVLTYNGIDPDAWNSVEGDTYEVNILSEEPLSNLKVEIISDYLTEEFLNSVGLTSTFDLAYPGEYEAKLAGFGFPIGDEVIGKNEVQFVLTPFIPLLSLGNGDGYYQHTFRLTVIDNAGNTKTTELKFDSSH